MRNLHAQRGQALLESAIFIPLFILVMVAMIFFAQFGVLIERGYSAVRYGSLISNRSNFQKTYSLAAMYHEFELEGPNTGTPPVSVMKCGDGSDSYVAATQDALFQAEPTPLPSAGSLPGPSAVASTQPFWKKTGPPAASCEAGTISVPNPPADLAIGYFRYERVDIRSDKSVPVALASLLGASRPVTASMSTIQAVSPDLNIQCSANFAAVIAAGLGRVAGNSSLVGPYAKYQPPAKPRVC